MDPDDSVGLLQAELRDRYAIGRELGRGGMAVVYLATDLRHDRPVAVKVLRPELRSIVGAERFLREIRLTARLQHPNILALHDSGEAAGLLYYVTPFIEGESLRRRLSREHRLPIADVVRLASEATDALDYAHARGVIHRDIKPDNILLAHGHAVIADFGIARAVNAAGPGGLTDSGVAVGTAAYMSPEQTAGVREIDGRSDIYSLGCVLYEVLAGQAPFSGPDGQVLLARRFAESAPHVGTERTDVPPALDAIVARTLARDPADRYATARELATALEECVALIHSDPRGVARVPPVVLPGTALPAERAPTGTTPAVRFWQRHPRLPYLLGALGIVLVLAGVALRDTIGSIWDRTKSLGVPNRDVVAVIPFEVVGGDTTVGQQIPFYLQDRLGGDVGPRVADPDQVVRLWGQRTGSRGAASTSQEMRVARLVGAGRVLRGKVLTSTQNLSIQAELLDVTTGEQRAKRSVTGPADSFFMLCDSIAFRLLGVEAGEGTARMNGLRAAPREAAFSYLRGRIAYARGRYEDAVAQFRRSLDVDSTLALAGLYLSVASNWVGVGNEDGERGLQRAWESKSQLNDADRTYLEGMAGSRYPEVPSIREQVDLWARAVRAAPVDPDPYFEWGERLFIYGAYIAEPNAREAARTQLRKAMQHRPDFVAPLERLAELAIMDGDTVQATALIATLESIDSLAERKGFLSWRLAVARGDSAELARIRAQIPRMSERSINRIWLSAQLSGVSLDDARIAVESLTARSGTADALANVARYFLEMNEGRPAAALPFVERTAGFREEISVLIDAQKVHDAMFGGGDSAAAAAALANLARSAEPRRSGLPPTRLDRAVPYIAMCVVNQWRIWHGDVRPADPALVPRLRALADTLKPLRLGGQSIPFIGSEPTCPVILDALIAVKQKRADANDAVTRLDRHMAQGPMDADAAIGNLLVADMLEQLGNRRAALAALRRRPYAPLGLFYLATSLRHEGRLAAAVGDTLGAVRAYEHYLRLRTDPEPSLRAEAAEVRAALDRLRTKVAVHRAKRGIDAAQRRARPDSVRVVGARTGR
jgi:tetratricopeptide (TPR) repeat protein